MVDMKIAGEWIFESFEEVLEFIGKPTHHERKHGITANEKSVIFDTPDLKVVTIKKSDNTKSFYIVFKNSVGNDVWKFWIPSETQAKMLCRLEQLYNEVNKSNEESREVR
ncbi:MAG: hypothetical protein PHV13_02535 [Candidatus ainarchaeum sp.]|nr:hypothetical protein [Candidatus ainarchaeum sp.]